MFRHNSLRSPANDCVYQLIETNNVDRFNDFGENGGPYMPGETQPLSEAAPAEGPVHKTALAPVSAIRHDSDDPAGESGCRHFPPPAPAARRHRSWRAWMTVAGGFLVHLSLGTIYTFGKFESCTR